MVAMKRGKSIDKAKLPMTPRQGGASMALLTNIIALAIHRNGGEPMKIKREDLSAIDGMQVHLNQIIGGDCDLLVELKKLGE
jgi:hypothetical protein